MPNSNKKMRAAIFDPYLDTVGGGERYVLTIAQILLKNGWDVELQWQNSKILKWIEERLGLNLSGIKIVDNISNGAGYHLIFWLSDGSVPLLFAKTNIIHFQTPFQNVHGKNILNRLKFLKVKNVVCNSKFTKNVIDHEFGLESDVVYPPVSVEEFKSGKKENIILSVGRFSKLQQSKRQDILVNSFIKMCKKGLKGWRLILIGGSDVGRGTFVDNLKNESVGYPIDILENIPFDEIIKYYAKAKIFWSASGFNVDEKKEPFKVEHFGITVVEGMASGAIPIIVNKGGHKEIVTNGVNGLLWDNTEELQAITLEIINNNKRREEIAKKAKERSGEFSITKFEANFIKLLQ